MHLQHPELLWGLLLLAIPILVHLLRLRRFRETRFTNVRILQRILAESNKSSQLKRWLLLLSRLGLLTALVLAFCQPYLKSQGSDLHKDIVVYLDNSLSMQGRRNETNLLQNTVQEMLQFFPEDLNFTLMTQSETYPDVRIGDLQQRLLDLGFSAATATAQDIRLRAESLFSKADSTDRQLWIFSDFNQWDATSWEGWDQASVSVVRTTSETLDNVVIDTAFIQTTGPESKELTAWLRVFGRDQNPPVSLYNGDTLIAKTGGERTPDGFLEARFTLPETQNLSGTLQITDDGLSYDNILYLTINRPQKIEVLSIGTDPASFLARIFTPEAFELKQSSLRELDYSILEQQHLILLNELDEIPRTLLDPLVSFVREGGSLILIPSHGANLNSYAPLLQSLGAGMAGRVDGSALISRINFEHPLFAGVFEKRIENFEYPQAGAYFPLKGNLPQVIGFQNGDSFLAGQDGVYLFSAPLSGTYSNFRQSPLIVPSLYAIGKGSLPNPDLYFQIGREAQLDARISLQEDEILQLRSDAYSCIPRQQSFARKTRLFFEEEPAVAGNYRIENRGELLQYASFNHRRTESIPGPADAALPEAFASYPNIERLVAGFQNSNRITSLWKWFVILALLFVLVEMILQKTMR